MNKIFTFLLLFFGLTTASSLNGQTTITGNTTLSFTSTGSTDVIIPCGFKADIQYEIWGGGGAGGYINTGNPLRAAAGGGGGGYSTGTIIGQGAGTYPVIVGAGGVLTNMTTNRQSGAPSSAFGVTSGGGQGAGGGAAAGNGGTGDIPGGAGGTRAGGGTSGIGGGGGGGSGPLAGPGANGVGAVGGAGGTTNGGAGGDDGMDGVDGTSPGGGGGGKGSGGTGLGGFKSGNGEDGQVVLIVTNYGPDPNCYPTNDECAELQPGSQTGNHASCNITYEEPDPAVIIEVPVFDCDDPTLIAVTFDTPDLPSSSSVLYHYWGNCAPLSPPMPEDIDPNHNGYIQQMFCDVDAFGLPAFPGGLSGETGTIGFLPKESEDVGCFGFADVATTCLCGAGDNSAGGTVVEHTASELIQLDFWMAIPDNQPQVGFRFTLDNREDAAAFFVGADLSQMCEVAYFTDGMSFGDLTDEPIGTYNIAAGQLMGTCGLSWMRVRAYINDIAHAFRVEPQINAGNGWVDVDQLLIIPATSADDNTIPTITLTSVEGYQIDGEFIYNDGGTWAPYGCNPVIAGTDTGVCNDPLPVEFVSFNAFLNDEQVTLKWQTASEENNEGFEIQKSSNGRDWEILDWVKGNGTTSEINTYDYLDRAPFAGDNYYRLKQIDYDGQFEFSNIAIIRYEVSGIVVEISPNPSPGDVNITVLNPEKERMSIELYDSTGLLIWQSGTLNNLDTWRKKFSLTQKEMYFISVQVGKEIFTKKILIIDKL